MGYWYGTRSHACLQRVFSQTAVNDTAFRERASDQSDQRIPKREQNKKKKKKKTITGDCICCTVTPRLPK